MEVAITKISQNGQVVIPSEIRKDAGIKPSAKFIVFNEDGNIIRDSEQMDEITQIIRAKPDEEPYIIGADPDTLDKWIEKCKNNRAAARKVMPEELLVLCMMVLIP